VQKGRQRERERERARECGENERVGTRARGGFIDQFPPPQHGEKILKHFFGSLRNQNRSRSIQSRRGIVSIERVFFSANEREREKDDEEGRTFDP